MIALTLGDVVVYGGIAIGVILVCVFVILTLLLFAGVKDGLQRKS